MGGMGGCPLIKTNSGFAPFKLGDHSTGELRAVMGRRAKAKTLPIGEVCLTTPDRDV